MSDTPRTDAIVESNRGKPCSQSVDCEFARQLERELAALRHDLALAVQRNTELLAEKKRANNVGFPILYNDMVIDRNYWRERAEKAKAERDAAVKDAERLNYLIANECQVWECNGRYAVHDVTEHHPATAEYDSARAAIDAARKDQP